MRAELIDIRRSRPQPFLERCDPPPWAVRAWLVHDGEHGPVVGLVELRQHKRPGRIAVVSRWVPWSVNRIGALPSCDTRHGAATSVLFTPPPVTEWKPPTDPVCEHIDEAREVGGDVTALYLALSHIVRHIDRLAQERRANPPALWREMATMRKWAELAMTRPEDRASGLEAVGHS